MFCVFCIYHFPERTQGRISILIEVGYATFSKVSVDD